MPMSDFRFKQFTIHQDHAAMKVGTDADLLGTMAEGGASILDIGTGTGVLSLMMAQRFPDAMVTAIDIDDNAILDASQNISESPFASRITLHHASLQDFLEEHPAPVYDSIICNPPYFDKSLECGKNESRTRARHTSSLPFSILVDGAYRLLHDGGVFSVCLPPEVIDDFHAECILKGFSLKVNNMVKSVPEKGPKRYILVYQKGYVPSPEEHTYCMRNADRTVSRWYKDLLSDFLL